MQTTKSLIDQSATNPLDNKVVKANEVQGEPTWRLVTPFRGNFKDSTGALVSMGSGNIVAADHINFPALRLVAAGNIHPFVIDFFDEVDTSKEIRIRPYFSHASVTTTDEVIFKFKYTASFASDMSWDTASSSVALSTATPDTEITFNAHACGSANPSLEMVQEATGKGIIPANSIAAAPVLVCHLEVDDIGTTTAAEIAVIGFWIGFYRKYGPVGALT